MELIIETQYLKVFWLKDLNTIIYRWLPANEKMTQEEYKNEMFNLFDNAMKVYRPTYVIVNATESLFIVVPELQIWVSENIIKPAVMMGLKRGFFVTTDDLIMQLVYEQIANEDPSIPFYSYQLKSEEEALQLIEQMC